MAVHLSNDAVRPKLRWVVLRHEGVPDEHHDLMFETTPGSVLRTYRIDHWPIALSADSTPLPDHRRHYLDYEGMISGGRGSVRRIASGKCTITELSSETILHLITPADVQLIISADGISIRSRAGA